MERPASAVNETAMSHLLVALHGLAAHALAADPDPAPAASAPEAAPASVTNADLRATLAYADGSTKSMHVTRIERTVDFYGDEGWTTDDGKLKLTVESGGKEKQVAWKDVKSISVVPGKIPDEVDCTYSSDFTPWMYECTLRTTANVTLKDGSKGTIGNRHRWRFSGEGGPVEFSVFKYTVREQDTSSADFGDAEENHGLYAKLQQQVRADAKGALLKSVTVQ
jgi:hypothetical protein